jgi:hypothetical protein
MARAKRRYGGCSGSRSRASTRSARWRDELRRQGENFEAVDLLLRQAFGAGFDLHDSYAKGAFLGRPA